MDFRPSDFGSPSASSPLNQPGDALSSAAIHQEASSLAGAQSYMQADVLRAGQGIPANASVNLVDLAGFKPAPVRPWTMSSNPWHFSGPSQVMSEPLSALAPAGSDATALSSAQAQIWQANPLSSLKLPVLSGLEASPLQALDLPLTAGADSSIMANAMAAASEPISPVIQLIMRMPGAIGLVNSFFEFLANFFLAPTSIFDLLNPSFLAEHAYAAFSFATQGSVHMPFSLSLLPANAPILSSLQGLGQPMFTSDLLSAKLNLSLGQSAYGSSALPGTFNRVGLDGYYSQMNVSGMNDPTKPLFEMSPGSDGSTSGALAGPHLSDAGAANHLAGNSRLFSDRIGGANINGMNLATSSPAPQAVSNAQAGVSGTPSLSSSALPSANQAGDGLVSQTDSLTEAARNSADLNHQNIGQNIGQDLGQDVGFNNQASTGNETASEVNGTNYGAIQDSSAAAASEPGFGPSGAVSDKLGGKNLLAFDQGQSFKPTLGSGEQAGSMPSTTGQSNAGSTPVGLKAKQLSLDGIDNSANNAAMPRHAHASGPTSKLPSAGAARPDSPAAHSQKHLLDRSGGVEKQTQSASTELKHATEQHHTARHAAEKHSITNHNTDKHVASGHGHSSSEGQQSHERLSHKQPIHEHKVAHPNTQKAEQAGSQGVEQATGQGVDGSQIASSESGEAASTYTIQKGDNLWNIARDHLGQGAKWHEIYEMNKNLIGENPDLIYPGTRLNLPGSPEIAANGSTTITNYTVKPGDNLWDISHNLLGKGSRWGELYQANQEVIGANPRLIHPGQQLTIPQDPSLATSTGADPGAAAQGTASPGAQSATAVPGGTNGGANMGDGQNGMMQDASQGAPRGELNPGGAQQAPGQGVRMDSPAPTRNMSYGAETNGPVPNSSFQGGPADYVTPQVQSSVPKVEAITQPVPSYPQGDHLSMNSFGPTLGSPQAMETPNQLAYSPSHSGGLPVLPANSQPIEAGPGAAQAATLHGPAPVKNLGGNSAPNVPGNSNGTLVATNLFDDIKSLISGKK